MKQHIFDIMILVSHLVELFFWFRVFRDRVLVVWEGLTQRPVNFITKPQLVNGWEEFDTWCTTSWFDFNIKVDFWGCLIKKTVYLIWFNLVKSNFYIIFINFKSWIYDILIWQMLWNIIFKIPLFLSHLSSWK